MYHNHIHNYEIEISKHAFERAMQRRISPDMIEATLKTGKIQRFAKNRLKFSKKYKRFTIVCIDNITGNKIKIVTIVTKNEKMY